MRRLLLPLFLGATLALPGLGCTPTGATVQATVATPELVEIRPGVWVVVDYRDPVFWHDGYYWRYYDHYWYRSPRFGYDWYRVHRTRVPTRVRRIERPRRYVRYQPPDDARVYRGVPPRHRRDDRTRRPPPHRRDVERVPTRRGRDHRDRPDPRRRDHRDR